MPRLIWSLTLRNCITLLLPQFSYSVSHPDSHGSLRALQALTMTSWSTIHRKFCDFFFFLFGLKEIDDMVIDRYGWWVIVEKVVAFAAQDVVWWLSQLGILYGSHRAWVGYQQALSPGIDAAQSCCLLCLMGEVEECGCLKGQCSPFMDSQVCVEWHWDQKCGRTIPHSAGSCGILHSVIQCTNLGQGSKNQDT